ncbi:hypothetical protein [Burkholderia cepacia]|uniref:hypothetical protein n=1 Tax=Burkholderia cepacia TaxID=292 RepID=UPI003EE266F6
MSEPADRMSVFDTAIFMLNGAILDCTAVGVMHVCGQVIDTEATRVSGAVVGAAVVAVLRL